MYLLTFSYTNVYHKHICVIHKNYFWCFWCKVSAILFVHIIYHVYACTWLRHAIWSIKVCSKISIGHIIFAKPYRIRYEQRVIFGIIQASSCWVVECTYSLWICILVSYRLEYTGDGFNTSVQFLVVILCVCHHRKPHHTTHKHK